MALGLEVLEADVAHARIRDTYLFVQIVSLGLGQSLYGVLPQRRVTQKERRGLIFPSSGLKAEGRDQRQFQLLSQQGSQGHRLGVKATS